MGLTVLGVDPALGGGFARVVADLDERLTILDATATYALSRTEDQIEAIAEFAKTYRPSIVIIEMDAQQKGLGNDDRLRALAMLYNFQIRPHITRGVKLDPVFGVASMDQSFRKQEISIPYKDQRTQDRMAPLIAQLRGWRPDVKTKNLTQDLVMALWFVWRYWYQIRKAHDAPPVPASRPSWLFAENTVRGGRLTA